MKFAREGRQNLGVLLNKKTYDVMVQLSQYSQTTATLDPEIILAKKV
jgi:hypothetical protein